MVSEDYESLPNISFIVQNAGQGPAKDITFELTVQVMVPPGLPAYCRAHT